MNALDRKLWVFFFFRQGSGIMIYDRITMKDVILGLLNQGGVSVGLLIIKRGFLILISSSPADPHHQ